MLNYLRRFIIVATVAIAGCGGGGGSPSPLPSTTQPLPTPTSAPQNYLPITNQAGFQNADTAHNSWQYTGVGPLAVQDPTYTSKNCSATLGTFGDYAFAAVQPLVDQTLVLSPPFVNTFPLYILSKNAAGDVYIVGYSVGGQPTVCVTPYVLVKAQMKAGDSWSYTDISGVTRTANVEYVGQPQSFTTGLGGPFGGITSAYKSVAQVNYGTNFIVYWAAGYGPVQTLNVQTQLGGPIWTAFGYVVDPNSK